MSKLLSALAKGTWLVGTAYTIGDIVDYLSSSYICIANSTGNTPPNATYWALLSSGVEWQGAWSAGTYTKAQAVSHEGNSWICNATSTTEEPTGTPTDWGKLSSKGDTGSTGATGSAGADGAESFTYIAYASDASGTGFTLTFNSSLDYIAIKTVTVEIPSPVVGDFTGLWKNYKGVTGSTGSTGATGVSNGLLYNFSTTTTDSDPGAGNLRLNHATIASATSIFIDNLENLTGDVSAFIDTWDDSTNSALRGHILLREVATKANFALFSVTGAVTDGTGYRKVVVTYVTGNGSFADTDEISVEFSRTGNKGTDGAGAGDVIGPASATDGAIALFDTTTGKLLKNSTLLPTTVGTALVNLTNPSAITFLRANADNSVTALSDTNFRTAIGLAIGSDVQAYDADLATIAGLTATTNNFMVGVASAWASVTPASARTALGLVIGTNVQAYDADLTTIAGLTATTDNFLVSVASAWASRTPAQVRTTLALVIGTNVQAWDTDLDDYAGKSAPTGAVVGTTDTQTLTNKRVTPKSTTEVSSATPTINTDNTDIHTITALAVAITSMTTNLSGTPTNGQKLIIRILDNATARAITWGASFVSRGATLPTTTTLSKYLYVGLIWNSTASVWDCVAVINES